MSLSCESRCSSLTAQTTLGDSIFLILAEKKTQPPTLFFVFFVMQAVNCEFTYGFSCSQFHHSHLIIKSQNETHLSMNEWMNEWINQSPETINLPTGGLMLSSVIDFANNEWGGQHSRTSRLVVNGLIFSIQVRVVIFETGGTKKWKRANKQRNRARAAIEFPTTLPRLATNKDDDVYIHNTINKFCSLLSRLSLLRTLYSKIWVQLAKFHKKCPRRCLDSCEATNVLLSRTNFNSIVQLQQLKISKFWVMLDKR